MMTLIFMYGVPVMGVLGFGHAVYQVFMNKLDAESMGMSKGILRMYGVADGIMMLGWIGVIVGLLQGATWVADLAIFTTGMFVFDYLVSLPSFEMMGDRLFKYWGSVSMILFLSYCVWLRAAG